MAHYRPGSGIQVTFTPKPGATIIQMFLEPPSGPRQAIGLAIPTPGLYVGTFIFDDTHIGLNVFHMIADAAIERLPVPVYY